MQEVMMVLIPVLCPHCQSDQIIKGGRRQPASNATSAKIRTVSTIPYQLDLTYKGRSPEVKEQIIDMALNGSGIRDTARVLKRG
jgi:transposase-like protein